MMNILKPDYTRFLAPTSPHPKKSKYTPHSQPVFASPWGPFPAVPKDLNFHELAFPPQNPLPRDYPLFINALTDETVSLHQFHRRVCALSRYFRHDGPNPHKFRPSPANDTEDGEILGIFSRNHIDYSMIAHACFRAELVFAGISPASTPYELWLMLRKMQVTSLIIHEGLSPVLRAALKLGRGENDKTSPLLLVLDLSKVIVLSEDRTVTFIEDLAFDAFSGDPSYVKSHPTVEYLIRRGEKMQDTPRKIVGGDKIAYLFQSSGTSGLPKAMMITHRNAIHSAIQGMIVLVQTAIYNGVEPLQPARLLSVVPAYHSYGNVLWILRVNLMPQTNVMMPQWDLKLALKSIQKYKITHLSLVPPLYRQLAQSPLTEKYDLSSVGSLASGAAYLPPDVACEAVKKFPGFKSGHVFSGYGLSEAVSVAGPAAPGIFGLEPVGPGMIGYLFPGMEGRIVDPETLKDVPKGDKGEMLVRGPVVTPGYFKDSHATKELFAEHGWLKTGDLVMRDEFDRIIFLDRLKELIKVKGLQVAPTEVENTLLEHPDGLVQDACVVGIDNGRGDGSQFIKGWVVLSDRGKKQEAEAVRTKLDEHVQQRLSRYKWLTGGIEIVESIPRTASGKMLRREMKEKYLARLRMQDEKSKL